ncbi:helix-turn-helix domain-containing protein [Aquibacillus rhizosphaerae]|uniref:Helix-turn-helix domain-containing protein n=1 Tax=Aquibacillus rhizosphaerae TaxID=3051431 RepID=A0ABT7L9T6_9BACI|nr:helix-turn-helix domain-containing protein [Aquibacillus sp. LR5S19]MDL4842613.1 helix-turn-helix domain-containing protein [Aquibacillus sp. LR5S19]
MIHIFEKWFRRTLSNTQTRLVLILMLSICVIILIVGLTSYNTSRNVLQKELNAPQQQMLQISMNHIDQYLKESDKVAIKLSLNSYVSEFLTNDNQISHRNISQLYQNLETLIKNTAYIHSIYIYSTDQKSIVGLPQGFSSDLTNFNDSKWVSVVDDFVEDEMVLVKQRFVPNGLKYEESNVTLFRKVMIQGEMKGVIAINLKHEDLFANLIPTDGFNSDSMRFIVDQSNNLLYVTKNNSFDSETLDYVMSNVNEGKLDEIKYQENILLTNQLQSSFTGWEYVSVVSQDSILAKAKTIRNVVFSMSLLALFVGIIVIIYIHTVELRPIRRIKQLFSMDEEQMYHRDLVHLERLVSDLVSDNKQLSRVIQKVRQEAITKFFYDIYKDKLKDGNELQDKWQMYFGKWTEDPMIIVMISMDNFYKWKDRFSRQYQSVIKFAISNVMTEVLSAHWRTVCVDVEQDTMVIMLQHREGKVELKNHLRIALSNIYEVLGFTVTVGVSNPRSGVEGIIPSIKEATIALDERLYKGYGKVISYKDVSRSDTQSTSINPIETEQLMEFIRVGDTQESIQRLHRIFAMIEQNHSDPRTVYLFLETLGERLMHRNANRQQVVTFVNQLKTMELKEILMLFIEKVTDRTEQIQQLSQSKQHILCQKMIDYMNAHLGDTIGIPECADSIGVSVSLASQWFKEETNETIYSYLTKLRMEKAAQLLVETDEKISTIAFKVGYQHENSFIRGFRKNKHMTPGKYREMLKKQANID